MAELKFIEKLSKIQADLNAPKNLYNNFGKYSYRSAEGILESVKPMLKEHILALTINDEIVEVGDRIYVKATATITDGENKSSTTAWAREPEDKKGMDASQITGSTSSYARKYALNGLFCIDDNKDADDTNTHEKEPSVKTATTKPIKATNSGDLKSLISEINTLAKKLAKTNEKEMTDILVDTIFTIDYTTIKDVGKAQEVLEKLKKI